MTKKQFIELAKVIKNNSIELIYRQDNGVEILVPAINKGGLLEDLCYILRQGNPNFKKEHFLEACGL